MNSRNTHQIDNSGFSLVELITAMTVLGILLAIAVPSFTNIIRANQIAAASNTLVSALALARSEAVKRGIPVSVCSAQNSTTCAAAANWGNGWIAFTDDFGAFGTIDASDAILQTWPAPSPGINIASANPEVTFARTGRAEFARSFAVTKTGCGADQRRDITVDLSGRVAIARSNCP